MSHRRISWSALPSKLLTSISDRLDTQTDVCSFRLVCKVWRDSTSFSTRTRPLNILSPLLPYEFPINEINLKEKLQTNFSVTLVPCSVFIVRSSVNNMLPIWLCAAEELTPGKFHFCNSSAKKSRQSLPECFNLAFFGVSELGRFCTLKCNANNTDKELYWHTQRLVGSKVVLFNNPKFGALAKIIDYKFIVLDNTGTLQLISTKHGIIDLLLGLGVKSCDDVVNFQERSFAVDRKGRLYQMGYNDTELKMVVSQPVGEGLGSDMKKRLVIDTSNGELYLIHRTPSYMKSIFKAYKLNLESKGWDEVAGIGVDRILVVIRQSCYFTTTKDIPGLGGNCIIFHNGDFPSYNTYMAENIAMYETGLFSFQDGSCKDIGGNLYPCFRPPPPWLSPDTKLFKSLSIPESVIVRDFCNHVVSESSCTTESCVAEAILHIKDNKHEEIQKMKRVARDHVRRMQKRQKLKRKR